MLLDQNLVDFSGMECNKVGVSYSGFRRQTGKCDLHQQSYVSIPQTSNWWHLHQVHACIKSLLVFFSVGASQVSHLTFGAMIT